tara:strand:- start:624 stop:932 length:309 start_codon:yes stop_codon:yes gene_type:complete
MSELDSDIVVVSESDSDSDYEPPVESVNSVGYSESTNKQVDRLRKLKEIGELRTENIIEIQHLEKLIIDSSMSDEQKFQTGKCLELLINCSNAYLKSYTDKV